MRIPNGLMTTEQLYFIAEAMAKYGDDYEAVVDITVRQNLQLRGLKVREEKEERDQRHLEQRLCFCEQLNLEV